MVEKNVKAYVIHSDTYKRTYTIFVDMDEKKFMYVLMETDPGKHSLIYKETVDDLIYGLKMLGMTDLLTEIQKLVDDITNTLLEE